MITYIYTITLLLFYSSVVVKTRAVKAVGGKRRVVLAETKDYNAQNSVHVERRKLHAKTRHKLAHLHMIQAQVLTLLSDMHLLLKRQRGKLP